MEHWKKKRKYDQIDLQSPDPEKSVYETWIDYVIRRIEATTDQDSFKTTMEDIASRVTVPSNVHNTVSQVRGRAWPSEAKACYG